LQAIEISRDLEQRFGSIPITNFTRFEVIQALRFEIWRNRNDRTRGLPREQANAALNLFLGEVGNCFLLNASQFFSFDQQQNQLANQQGLDTPLLVQR
jgi:hypothetical protein